MSDEQAVLDANQAFYTAFAGGDMAAALEGFVDYWNGRGAWAAMHQEGRAKILARGPKMMCELAAVDA
ncbi:MAG: hypothetical protein QF767_08390, partial [Alphaproteobacteria bacterium]|nr:hypothetical protein [Alphaproteobacteria bacterium]